MQAFVLTMALLGQTPPAPTSAETAPAREAAADSDSCRPDGEGFCTGKVVRHALSYVDGAQRLQINCAVGDVVSLEFPDGVERRGEPALGNQALFAFQASSSPFRVLVWPKLPKGARGVRIEDLHGVTSSLQVFLDSGVAVLVDLRIGPRATAVQRVVFDFPARERESEWVQSQLSERTRKMRSEFEAERAQIEETVGARTKAALAAALLERHHCEPLYRRAERGLLIVWGDEICRLGKYTLVRFRVQNRYRDFAVLDRVEVREVKGKEDGPLDAHIEWSSAPRLGFGHEVQAVAIFEVEAGARSYALRLVENGGKKRVVELDGVEF